ncbi:MAG TPA: hypothetical protein VE422_21125 [Terriglobia bacterium]|nr:hypothetical protein [Terriglobia bacterium]
MRNPGWVCLPVILTVFALDSSAQTIADIARRERARQGRIQSTVNVGNGATVTTAASTSATAVSVTTKPTGPTDNKGRPESYWRDAFQKARADLNRADGKVQVLEQKLRDLNMQILRQSDVYNREYRLNGEIAAAQTELDNARRDSEQARQNIAGLEDELRRSEGPAGWAR